MPQRTSPAVKAEASSVEQTSIQGATLLAPNDKIIPPTPVIPLSKAIHLLFVLALDASLSAIPVVPCGLGLNLSQNENAKQQNNANTKKPNAIKPKTYPTSKTKMN